jgi:hypothetical protein
MSHDELEEIRENAREYLALWRDNYASGRERW